MREDTKWILTDNDCAQYVRKTGSVYEMIQAVWLDRTSDEIGKTPQYVIVKDAVDMSLIDPCELECAISVYGYDELPDGWICAECYLEEDCLYDGCIIGEAETFEEARAFIEEFIRRNNNG